MKAFSETLNMNIRHQDFVEQGTKKILENKVASTRREGLPNCCEKGQYHFPFKKKFLQIYPGQIE